MNGRRVCRANRASIRDVEADYEGEGEGEEGQRQRRPCVSRVVSLSLSLSLSTTGTRRSISRAVADTRSRRGGILRERDPSPYALPTLAYDTYILHETVRNKYHLSAILFLFQTIIYRLSSRESLRISVDFNGTYIIKIK